jgi:thiosulfate dehydrogenase [quinone] large subunit
VLSLTLFLTVSFHSSPYYTGADIVFLFAWSPLLLAGAGGVLSLDAVIASWTRHEVGLGSPIPVPVRFSLVQQVCGSFEDERCRARRGAPCNPRGCPFLPEPRRRGSRVALDSVDRRAVILGGAAAGATAGIGLISAGLVAGIGRLAGGVKAPSAGSTAVLSAKAPLEGTPGTSHAASTPGTSHAASTPGTSHAASTPGTPGTSTTGSGPTGGAVPSGTPIGLAAEVPVGGAARFTDPSSGDPGLVLQLSRGTFVAYDAVCPHAGCTVGYSPAADVIVCPCHGSEFSPDTGSVEVGPAPRGLTVIPVQEGPDGQLYVDG